MIEQKHYEITQSKRLFSRFTALLILPIATTMRCNERLVDHKTPSRVFMPFYSASALTEAARCRFSTTIGWMAAVGTVVPSIAIALAAEQLSTSPSTVTEEQLSATQQAAGVVATQRTHRVSDGDTLWNVAKRLRPSYMSIAATMDLLYATNPEAFLDGDSTKLQKGYLLRFTPPAVQLAALNETAESIDTSTVIPRVDSLASPDSAEPVMVDSTQTKFDSELSNKDTAVTPEPVKLTPELNPQLTPELTPEPTPKTEPTGQSTAHLQSQLQTQLQSQRKSDQRRQPETENPLLVEPVEVKPVEIEPGDSFESQIDGAEQSAQALRNQQLQPQPLESALHSTTEASTQYSAEANESQSATALLPNDPVESKPPSIVELAQLKAVLDDFRRDPPYTAMLAALLALVFITLGVRRLRKPLASSNHTNKSDQSSAQSTPSSADNSQQSTDGVSHTENTDNLVDSVLSGPFAADSDDASGIFADAESFGDAVDNFAENAAENKPTNLNNPESEMDLPGQKELEAQMGDKFAELQADDLVTADDAEHLDYIDPLKVKLDMATLCAEMGDQQTAREILEEIISEADEAGRAQAQAILDQLDD